MSKCEHIINAEKWFSLIYNTVETIQGVPKKSRYKFSKSCKIVLKSSSQIRLLPQIKEI